MKRYLTLVIRVTQIKTIVKSHFTLIGMAKTKGVWRNLNPQTVLVRTLNGTVTLDKFGSFSVK